MFIRDASEESLTTERRWGFFSFNLFLVWVGAMLMALRVSENGWTFGGLTLFALFVVLLAQVVYGFTLAVAGWWLLRHGGDPASLNRTLPPDAVPGRLPATAIVMPICDEDVNRVFQGLRVVYESLQATGWGNEFDFFVLSDTSDANLWIAEETAWFELCKQVRGFGRIFYRKRRRPLHHKSGNIADFCRRWGAKYRCLIVLDADSVMTGATIVRLASLMKANPQVGLIQTNPKLVLGRSLFQRINQFACQAYGPMFVAGASFWQLDNANFYGHNAIIRLQPFMNYCAMPELPPSGSLGTRILSHDTVEAAFMRRAGYEVWSAYDLAGSYEEVPPHLPASLKRDQRWCHGNLQHLWFLFAPGLTWSSRVNMLLGILAYVSSPLWLLFVLLSPLLLIDGHPPVVGVLLFAYVMGLLLAPKLLGALRIMAPAGPATAFGSRGKVLLNIIAETIYSLILAPILMLFYTQFVWSAFFRGEVAWGGQQRTDDAGPSWRECAAMHLGHTLLGIAAGVLLAWAAPAMLPWLLLVLIGPLVAIPFSRLLASNAVGLSSRRQGWFLIPEESQPPQELRRILEPCESPASAFPPIMERSRNFGLLQAVLDPRLNTIHVSLLRKRTQMSVRTREYLAALGGRLLREGPSALTPAELKTLLWDAEAMLAMHQQLWRCPVAQMHAWWHAAFRIYNQTSKRRTDSLQIA